MMMKKSIESIGFQIEITHFFSILKVELVHFEVVSTANKFLLILVQAGRKDFGRNLKFFDLVKLGRIPKADLVGIANSQDLSIFGHFNAGRVGWKVDLFDLNAVVDVPITQRSIIGNGDHILVVIGEQSLFQATSVSGQHFRVCVGEKMESSMKEINR